MPYLWRDNPAAPEQSGAASHELLLWPHRSLPLTGFVWFIGITAALIAVPLLAVVGHAVLWGLLPFAAAAVAGLWFAIIRNYRSGQTRELLRLSPEALDLTRSDPGRPDRHWRANPYWVRVALRGDGPVEAYLTLSAEGREIELGAFLSPDERRALEAELRRRLSGLRGAAD